MRSIGVCRTRSEPEASRQLQLSRGACRHRQLKQARPDRADEIGVIDAVREVERVEAEGQRPRLRLAFRETHVPRDADVERGEAGAFESVARDAGRPRASTRIIEDVFSKELRV